MTRPDPMEELIAAALREAGEPFDRPPPAGSAATTLDFHLPERDLYIEVKQFHSSRVAAQMAKHPNVIAAQGREAVALLAELLRRIND